MFGDNGKGGFAFGGEDKSDEELQKQFSIDPADEHNDESSDSQTEETEDVFGLGDIGFDSEDELDDSNDIIVDDEDSLYLDDGDNGPDIDFSDDLNTGLDTTPEEISSMAPPTLPSLPSTPPPSPSSATPSTPVPEQPSSVFGGEYVPPVVSSSRQENDGEVSLSPGYQTNLNKLIDALIDESSELILNGPKNIIQKKNGSRIKLDINFSSIPEYHKAIDEGILVYVEGKPKIDDNKDIVEARLLWDEDKSVPPVVARVHALVPPSAPYAYVTVAKKARRSLSLDDLVSSGSMSRQMSQFIQACAQGRVNILLSGQGGTGKTTLLEAIGQHFDANDRLIVIEDTRELQFNNVFDAVYLTSQAVGPEQSMKGADLEWFVRQANRMRPDRIIVGELRSGEAAEFLVAANSGADGSISTVHAATPRRALTKMQLLALKGSGQQVSDNTIKREIAETLQIVIQLSFINGRHIVSKIEEISSTISDTTGVISSQTLFSYDKSAQKHIAEGRPSENLLEYMQHRSVIVRNDWFL